MPRKLEWPYISFEVLDCEIRKLIQLRKSVGTIGCWEGSQAHFKSWCDIYDMNPFDTELLYDQWMFMRFCVYRFLQHGIRSKYARNQVYAIRDLRMQIGLVPEGDSKQMPLLHHMLDGRDKQAPPGTGAKPITNELLIEMFDLDIMNKSNYDHCIFRLAFALAHNTIRRVGEEIAKSVGGLKVENIIFIGGKDTKTPAPFSDMKGSAILVFLFAKGNQLGETQSAPLLHLCQLGEICAYCELYRIWAFRRSNHWNDNDLLFMFNNGTKLTYPKFNKQLKCCGAALGFDPKIMQCHGFRGGGNLDAKLKGVEGNNRNIMAGWKSDKTRLKYEYKMEPQHLHYLVAKDYGIPIHKVPTIAFNKILKTRKEKIDLRRKQLEKKIKLNSKKSLKNKRKLIKKIKKVSFRKKKKGELIKIKVPKKSPLRRQREKFLKLKKWSR